MVARTATRGYLLDTDTCIEILRGNRRVIQKRRGIYADVLTSEITASELYFGAANSQDPPKHKAEVDQFLKTLPVVPIGRHGAQFFGALKAQLRRAGRLIPDADLWIASIARALDFTVVTGNTKHLARVPRLTTCDWIRGQEGSGE
ncbi:MAG: type II toxin-antitoxin system VapC family toxin [Verrucomicrobiota bacterium]